MRRLIRFSLPLLIALAVAGGAARDSRAAGAPAQRWVCPPCGLPGDSVVYDHPGTCPRCGMALVDEATAKAMAEASHRRKVAILVFDGVEIIDFAGPYELFGAAGLDVYTVGATRDPVTTAMGLTVVPRYAFADAPQPDLLVVPGGGVAAARRDSALLGWVRRINAGDRQTMSVCNGAFILGSAGLLDGLRATTTSTQLDNLQRAFPGTKVVWDERFVDNGKVITTAGLTAGMDGALHAIARLLGEGQAQQVALSEEYDWHPHAGFVRAQLADMNIPNVDIDSMGKWDVVKTQGDTGRWDLVIHGESDRTGAELMGALDRALAESGQWKRLGGRPAGAATPATSRWAFHGRDGRPWTGTLTVATEPGRKGRYTLELKIARAG